MQGCYRKSKILIVGSLPPPYHGVTVFNEGLLNSKISNIYKVCHLDTSDKRNLDNLGKVDLQNVYLALKNLRDLMKLCIGKKPDLVYLPIAQNIAYLRDGMFIAIAKFFGGAKIIIHLHGSYFKQYYDDTNRFMKQFIDLTIKHVDTAIVLGNCLTHIFDGLVKNIEVVPNGTPFNPDLNGKYKMEKEGLTISYLGNLFKSKGVVDLIKASKMVVDKYPDTKFRFAGEWRSWESKTKEYAIEFVKKNNLEKNVKFVGVVLGEEKEKFLVDADIFVLPSWYKYEGHPIVIIEAMAAGCPVISTKNVGAIPETVVDGKTGILVEKKDPKAVAQAIIRFIEHPGLRIKMGMAARKRYKQYYTQEKNTENMVRVFEHTLKRENA